MRYWLLLELLCGEFKKNTTVFTLSSKQLKDALFIKFDKKLQTFAQLLTNFSQTFDQESVNFRQTSENFWQIETRILLDLMGKDFKRTRQCSGNATPKKKEKEEEEEERVKSKGVAKKVAPPHRLSQDIFNAYNQTLKEKLPAAKVLTPTRIKNIKALSINLPGLENIAGWQIYFDKVLQTPFLLGSNDRAWRADFDWLIKLTNAIKVAEGRYENLGASKAQVIQNNLLNMENPYAKK